MRATERDEKLAAIRADRFRRQGAPEAERGAVIRSVVATQALAGVNAEWLLDLR